MEGERTRPSGRVTELYTMAAEQLGSDKAPVRMAGLYALERLAQSNPPHRQTIVNIICAYLRMPFTPPRGVTGEEDGDFSQEVENARREELQVRRAAQRILEEHLTGTGEYEATADEWPAIGETYWPEIDVDLSGATMVDLNFQRCHPANCSFSGARLHGHALFHGVVFHGDATFNGAIFYGHAGFEEAAFHGVVDFETTVFRTSVGFDGAIVRHGNGVNPPRGWAPVFEHGTDDEFGEIVKIHGGP